MTKAERALAQQLQSFETVSLEKYRSVNGKEYFKAKYNGTPLMLIPKSVFYKMERREGLISGQHSLYQLNVTQLRANLLDWQSKQKPKQ